jgi:hypothetical protein
MAPTIGRAGAGFLESCEASKSGVGVEMHRQLGFEIRTVAGIAVADISLGLEIR